MHVKEYRIPLPLTVEEYRIAQLYMIQKKSRDESSGAGSGVEIIKNQPYSDGPGGSGQYTYKIYHIGSHLPNWFRSILPKSALRIEEEAWNAYPYTKTIFRCPFVEKFSITIETVYKPDGGTQENVFSLSQPELRNRVVDLLDFVKDPLPSGDYQIDEDPRLFVSSNTGRGPLSVDWLKERTVKGPTGGPVMCAYKICYVEFKYWGMQTKIEKFIHDTALRKTMVRAHRQAWAWQDEWVGLTIDDIRGLEAATQQALAQKMDFHDGESSPLRTSVIIPQLLETDENPSSDVVSDRPNGDTEPPPSSAAVSRRIRWHQSDSTSSSTIIGSPSPGSRVSWNSLEQIKDGSDDEFFDAQDELEEEEEFLDPDCVNLQRSNSIDEDSFTDGRKTSCSPQSSASGSVFGSPSKRMMQQATLDELDSGASCNVCALFIVLHGGNALLVESDKNSKLSDLSTWKATFEKVVSHHYPNFIGRYNIKLVSCPAIHSDALNLLSSINPYCHHASDSESQVYNEYFPISAVPLLATQSADYQDSLVTVSNRANKAYRDFLLSDEGHGFNGQVVLIGDCMGSVMAFDILCSLHSELTFSLGGCASNKKKYASDTNLAESALPREVVDFSEKKIRKARTFDEESSTSVLDLVAGDPASLPASGLSKLTSAPVLQSPASSAHLSQQAQRMDTRGFEFDVSDFFMFGSPLPLVLANRIIRNGPDSQARPNCFQVYNLFHTTDPCAGRLESLLDGSFSHVDTVKVPRYQNFPLGDGQSNSLFDCLQRYGLFSECPSPLPPSLVRQGSNASYLSTASVDLNLESVASVARKWWGNKRLDYAMYCPEALQRFPTNALPHLFHANFWESMDAVSFIVRQVLVPDGCMSSDIQMNGDNQLFQPHQPREKWKSRRSAIKTKNITPNHRGNDILIVEDKPQRLSARFMYGPLDLVTLCNEKVDVHIVTDPATKQWEYMGMSTTDKYGRVVFQIPTEKRLPQGLYPVKMVVRGDHTFTDLSLLVLPPKANVVLFSIDGSFTASVSIMGKDPKVRPGAVDVVRYWQDLGYCILYISARPDMQLRKVVSWLAQHNFPHGMLTFMDGVSADPMKQKTQHLKTLVKESAIEIVASYGSYKDIIVYQSIELDPSQIYIVGKVPKKAHNFAQTKSQSFKHRSVDISLRSQAEEVIFGENTSGHPLLGHRLIADNFNPSWVLDDGYAAHLKDLQLRTKIPPATGNTRLFLQKSSFVLPGQKPKKPSPKSHRGSLTLSMSGGDSIPAITVDKSGNTAVDPGAAGGSGNYSKVRGRSPRLLVNLQRIPDNTACHPKSSSSSSS